MTIGLVLSSVPAYSETFFVKKINGLVQHGFTVLLFARGKARPDLNCTVIRPYRIFESPLARILMVLLVLPFVFIRHPWNVIRFWKLERSRGTAVSETIRRTYVNAHILTHELDWLHFGFVTMALGRELVAKSIGARMAVSFRGYDINVFPLSRPGCYHDVWKQTAKVQSISEYLLKQACALGLPKDIKTQVITPAVPTALQTKDDFRFEKSVKLVTVARLHWIKGLEYAIQAIASLKSQGIDLEYAIIGEGAEHQKLLYEIHALNLQKEVTLMGKLSHEEAVARIARADIYLQPSLNEGFCNAVLEAQSMGCLCIVSDAGALSENLVDGQTGWLVPPRDAQALASTILKVIQSEPEELLRVSGQARARVARDFGIEDHLERWKKFYEDQTTNPED